MSHSAAPDGAQGARFEPTKSLAPTCSSESLDFDVILDSSAFLYSKAAGKKAAEKARKWSLFSFALWIVVVFVCWWHLTSVKKFPMPKAKIKVIHREVARLQESSTLIKPSLKSQQGLIAKLCRAKGLESSFLPSQPPPYKHSSSLFDVSTVVSEVSVEEVVQTLMPSTCSIVRRLQSSIERFCRAQVNNAEGEDAEAESLQREQSASSFSLMEDAAAFLKGAGGYSDVEAECVQIVQVQLQKSDFRGFKSIGVAPTYLVLVTDSRSSTARACHNENVNNTAKAVDAVYLSQEPVAVIVTSPCAESQPSSRQLEEVGIESGGDNVYVDLDAAVQGVLRNWFPDLAASGERQRIKSVSPSAAAEEMTTALTSIKLNPQYAFKWMLLTDESDRIYWDFRSDFQDGLMKSTLEALRRAISFTMQSSIVHHAGLLELSHLHRQTTKFDLRACFPDSHPAEEIRLIPSSQLASFLGLSDTWRSDDVLSAPSTNPATPLHFAVWLPTKSIPVLLRFYDDTSPLNSCGQLRQSFSIPSWGAVVVVDPDTTTLKDDINHNKSNSNTAPMEDVDTTAWGNTMSIAQKEAAVRLWLPHIRSLFGLHALNLSGHLKFCIGDSSIMCLGGRETITTKITSPDNRGSRLIQKSVIRSRATPTSAALTVWSELPSRTGFTEWEVSSLQRLIVSSSIIEGGQTLHALIGLLRSLPDLVVEKRVVKTAELAADDLLAAIHAIKGKRGSSVEQSGADLADRLEADDRNGTFLELTSMASALSHGRKGWKAALEVFHDESTMAESYFGIEFKTALYLPVGLPLLLPFVIALLTEVKLWRRKQKRRIKQQ